MVAGNAPDSLPSGWTEQVKVTNGRKIKCYTNSDTGQKFYSKKDVIRYVNSGNVRSGAPQSRSKHNNRSSQNKPGPIAVKTNESSEWLPHGWIMEMKTGKSGYQYKCYIDPATGRKFYSKPEVSRYVETLKCNSGMNKEGNIDNGDTSNNVVKTSKSPEVTTSESPVWRLPDGWIMKVKTQKNGSKYKCYFDPETGCKLYSKAAVSRYIESLKGDSGTEKKEYIDNGTISNIVGKTSEAPEWLPHGWIVEWKTRKSGSKHKCYIDPATGHKFHSKTAVSQYLETVKCNGGTAKEKQIDNDAISNMGTTNESPDWLPHGWITEVKTQTNGSQYKCYTDPETGRKFYSKPAVSRYIKTVKCNGGTAVEKKIDNDAISNREATNESPEWLPHGWIMEVKTHKDGSKHKCYTDPETGRKFYSKPTVSRYLESVKCNGRTAKEKKMDIGSISNAVVGTISPEGLPPGWIKEIRARKFGNGMKKDPYYLDPVSGYEFRSKLDAFRYLETGDVARCAMKPKKRGINDTVMKNDDISSDIVNSTGGKSSVKPDISQNCETVVVETSSPEGLPPGWIKEIRARKLANGIRKDPYYVDPVSGYEFRSKLDAFRYLETGDVSRCAMKPKKKGINDRVMKNDISSDIVNSTGGKSSVKPDVSQNCETVVVGTISPDGLPPGWIKEIRARKFGNGIKKDPYYVDPVSGYEFRSKLDAFRYLETGDVARCTMKPKKRGINDTVMKHDIGSDIGNSSGGKSSVTPDVSQNCGTVRSKSFTSKQNKIGISKHSMNEVVVETSSPEGLPPGWFKEIRAKKLANRIRKDPYYVDPVSGYEFRSKLDALRYLETGDVAICAIKPKKRGNNDSLMQNDICASVPCLSPSTVGGKKLRHSTRRQLFEGKESLETRNLKSLEAESSKAKQGNSVSADTMLISAPTPEIIGEKHSFDNANGMFTEMNESSNPKTKGFKRKRGLTSVPSATDLSQEQKLPQNVMEQHKEKTQIGSSKSKKKIEVNMVGRSSKRLAGVKPEIPANLELSERGLRSGTRKSTETEVDPSSSLGLDVAGHGEIVEHASIGEEVLLDNPSSSLGPDVAGHGPPQPEAEPEAEIVDHASIGKEALLDIEPSSKIEKPVEDQYLSKEQEAILKTEKQDGGTAAESRDAQLLYSFDGSAPDPCLDFAFKTLTGAVPVEDNLAVKDYFQQQSDSSRTQIHGALGLPGFGVPSFFHNDPSPRFDSPEKRTSMPCFSPNRTFLPRGNVNLPSWAIGNVNVPSSPPVNVNIPSGLPGNVNLPSWPPGNVNIPSMLPRNVNQSSWTPGNVNVPSGLPGNVNQPSWLPGNVDERSGLQENVNRSSSTGGLGPQQPSLDAGTRNIRRWWE